MHSKEQPSLAAKIVGVVALVIFILICMQALKDEIRMNDVYTGRDHQKAAGQGQR